MELQFLEWLQTWHFSLLDRVMVFVTHLGDGGLYGLLLTVLLLLFKKTRRVGVLLFIAMSLNVLLCNVCLKPVIARPRPFIENPTVQLLIKAPKDASFPSGHTSMAFTIVSVFYFLKERRWFWVSLVLACLIAFSRLYLYVHYPTDVLGGILVGGLSGRLGVWLFHHYHIGGTNGKRGK